MPRGANHGKAAALGHLIVVGLIGAAELDVRTAAGHLCGDGYPPNIAGFGDNLCLFAVIFRVEHVDFDIAIAQGLS